MQLVIPIKNGIIKHVNLNDYSWNLSTCCGNSKYLKIVVDDSVILCDENLYIMDIVSTKMTNSIAASPAWNNFDVKKVRYKIDCHILHAILLVIILLLIITITWFMQSIGQSKNALKH